MQTKTINGTTFYLVDTAEERQDVSEWKQLRKGKVTASIVGSLPTNNSLTSEIFNIAYERIHAHTREEVSTKAMKHGNKHEADVLALWGHTNKQSVNTALIFGWNESLQLGASPDAFIGQFGQDNACLLEVKCPIDGNAMMLNEAFSIVLGTGNHAVSSKSVAQARKYHMQVQAQMLVLQFNKAKILIGEAVNDGDSKIVRVFEIDVLREEVVQHTIIDIVKTANKAIDSIVQRYAKS